MLFFFTLLFLIPLWMTTPTDYRYRIAYGYISIFQITIIAGMLLYFFCLGILAKLPKKLIPVVYCVVLILAVISIKTFIPEIYSGSLPYLFSIYWGGFTISELEPLFNLGYEFIFYNYGLTLFLGFFGLSLYIVLLILKFDKFSHKDTLFILWTAVMLFLAIFQNRYSYYLAINMAILTVYAVFRFESLKGSKRKQIKREEPGENREWKRKLKIIHKIVIIAVFLIILSSNGYFSVAHLKMGQDIDPDTLESLYWLRENLPLSEEYDLFGSPPPDEGVMAFWDYGYWILYIARRPVITANNHNHQTISISSIFFMSSDESKANDIMEEVEARFVYVDSGIGFVKESRFGQMADSAGRNASDFSFDYYLMTPFNQLPVLSANDEYYRTMYLKLYLFDGSSSTTPLMDEVDGLEHYRLIYESQAYDGLEHYRLDHKSPAFFSYVHNVNKVKIFEYVKGFTLKGKVNPNLEYEVTTTVETPTGRRFLYRIKDRSDNNGHFSVTLPYPTTDVKYGARSIDGYRFLSHGMMAPIEIEITEDDVVEGRRMEIQEFYLSYENTTQAEKSKEVEIKKIEIKEVWKFEVGREIVYSPAVSNGIIFIPTPDGKMFVINPEDGSSRFIMDLGGEVRATASSYKGSIFVPMVDGRIYEVDAEELRVKRSVDLKQSPWSGQGDAELTLISSPEVIDLGFFIGATDNGMYLVEMKTFRSVGSYLAKWAVVSKPAVFEDMVVVASYDGTVYALNYISGDLIWTYVVGDIMWSGPAISNGMVYFGARDNSIHAIDLETGKEVWRFGKEPSSL